MRRSILIAASAALAAALLVPALVAAAPPVLGQNWGKSVNASACSGGTLVLNITYGVTNDADSGYGGYWALDNYQKLVQVWQESDGSFCVVAHYAGTFTTLAGATDPDGSGTLTGGFTGTFAGGYWSPFSGTLNPNPAYPTTGYIGTFDLGGSMSGDATPFDWTSVYFSSVDWSTWTEPFWGWVYQGGSCGTWYNTIDLPIGSGNIAC